jgi:hypothetical protein
MPESEGRLQARSNVEVVTVEELTERLNGLRAQLLTWEALENAWGSIDRLRAEIDTAEWLRGDHA